MGLLDQNDESDLFAQTGSPVALSLSNFQNYMRDSTAPWVQNLQSPNPAPATPIVPVRETDPDKIAGPAAVIDQIADNYPAATPMDMASQIGNDKETTVTSKKQTKAEKEAEKALASTFDQQGANEKEKTDLAVQKANDIDRQAQKELEVSQEIDRKRAEKEAYANRKLQEADAYLAAKRRDYEENGTIKDMFGGDVGKRVNAALLSGIGAFASARGSGAGNLAGEQIDSALKEWHDREMSRIKQSESLLNMSREDREHALATADLELKNREASMLDVAAKQRAKILASYGAPEAAIAGDRAMIDIQQKKQEKLQQIQEGLRTTITTKQTNQTEQEAKKAAVAAAIKKGELGKPEQNTLEKVGELNNYLSTMDKTLQLAKERPDLVENVMRARRQWQKLQGEENIPFIGKAGVGIGRVLGVAPQTEEEAMSGKFGDWFGKNATKSLSSEDAAKARELFKGIKNIEVGKGMTFGGVLRDSDVGLAQNIAGTLYGSPGEQIKAIENFRNDISQRRDLLTKNKDINMPGNSPASSNAGKVTQEEYSKGIATLEKMDKQGKRGSPEWNRLVTALRNASKELQ